MNLIEKLEKIKEKYEQINEQLSDSSFSSDREKMINLGKERSELEEIVGVYEQYSTVLQNIEGNNHAPKSCCKIGKKSNKQYPPKVDPAIEEFCCE